MKFKISFKTPDALDDGIRSALAEANVPDGVDAEGNMDQRQTLTRAMWELSSKFIEFGEFCVIEFDTDAGTANVVRLHK